MIQTHKVIVAVNLFFGLTILPSLAIAQTSTPGPTRSYFCSRLEDRYGDYADRIGDRQFEVTEKRLERATASPLAQNERERFRSINRAENWVRNVNFPKWEAEVIRDGDQVEPSLSERQATLEQVRTTVEAAHQEHDATVEELAQTFKAQFLAMISENHDRLVTAVDTFKGDVEAALSEALAECEAGIESSVISSKFFGVIRNANSTLRNEAREVRKITVLARPFVEERREGIQEADREFRIVINQALRDLRTGIWGN